MIPRHAWGRCSVSWARSQQGEKAPTYEYKILTERDSRLAGSFDTEVLETALSSYAAEGWRVVDSFLAASLWKSIKVAIVVILEREQGVSEKAMGKTA